MKRPMMLFQPPLDHNLTVHLPYKCISKQIFCLCIYHIIKNI